MSQMTENRPPYFSGIVVTSGPTKIPMGPQYRPCLPRPPREANRISFSSLQCLRGDGRPVFFLAESMGIDGSDVGDVWMDPGWILAVLQTANLSQKKQPHGHLHSHVAILLHASLAVKKTIPFWG